MTRSSKWLRPRFAAPWWSRHLRLGAASAILCAVCLAASARPAQAVTGPTAALSFVDIVRDGVDGVQGLYGARAVVVSPDGGHVYVVGEFDNTVAVFARNATTGALRFVEVHRHAADDGLGGPIKIALSPDGAHAYVTGGFDDGAFALTVFARDAVTGKLTRVEEARVSGWTGLLDVWGVTVSPDGAHVYVSGYGHDAIAVFVRDRATGMLTLVDMWRGATGIGPGTLTVSPDGAHLYVAAFSRNAIEVLARDVATGQLALVEEKPAGLGGAFAVTVSPDGSNVYATGYSPGSLVAFARDAETGKLTLMETHRDGSAGIDDLAGAFDAVMSPDGARLYVTSAYDHAVLVFARDPLTGTLALVQVLRDEESGVDGLGTALGLGVSPDGAHVYVAGHADNAVVLLSVNANRCAGDCSGDGQVTIDELLRGVNIALGSLPVSACARLDRSADGAVSVDEILTAVGSALDGCPATLVPGDHARSLVFHGKTRLYDLHVPPGYHGTATMPLVLDFHGFGKNKTWQAGLSGFKELADIEGFIVAYPLGSFGAKNDPEAPTTVGPAWDGWCCTLIPVDDVGFARAVVQAVAAEASIDRRRVYATGTSNGGALSHRLACEAADTFAAVAPMAYPLAAEPLSECQPSRPIAVLAFAGLTDTEVPYEGGSLPSAAESFAYWRDVNGCGSGSPDQRVDAGASRCETYTQCDAGVHVGLCSITANPTSYAPGHVLYQNPDFDVTAVAWQFLSQFTLPATQ